MKTRSFSFCLVFISLLFSCSKTDKSPSQDDYGTYFVCSHIFIDSSGAYKFTDLSQIPKGENFYQYKDELGEVSKIQFGVGDSDSSTYVVFNVGREVKKWIEISDKTDQDSVFTFLFRLNSNSFTDTMMVYNPFIYDLNNRIFAEFIVYNGDTVYDSVNKQVPYLIHR